MMAIPVTLFASGVLGILCVVLSVMVSVARGRTKVMIGDGGGAAGAEPLLLAIRAQGNFVEYVPLALILLGGVEVSGASHLTCEVFAGMLIAGRLLHPVGIIKAELKAFRGLGALLTWLAVLGLGVEALWLLR